MQLPYANLEPFTIISSSCSYFLLISIMIITTSTHLDIQLSFYATVLLKSNVYGYTTVVLCYQDIFRTNILQFTMVFLRPNFAVHDIFSVNLRSSPWYFLGQISQKFLHFTLIFLGQTLQFIMIFLGPTVVIHLDIFSAKIFSSPW